MGPELVPRRRLLLGTAVGAAVAGCARIARRTAAVTGHASPAAPTPLVGLLWSMRNQGVAHALAAALPRAVPGLALYAGQGIPPRSAPLRWWIQFGDGPMAYAVGLATALREVNFDPSVLVPGLLAGTGYPKSRFSESLMPTRLEPLVVRYNAAAFHAAGVAEPGSGWTIDDFEVACVALDSAIRDGKLQGLGVDFVLYPLWTHVPPMSVSYYNYVTVTLQTPALWEAFITGYWGSVVEGTSTVRWDSGPALQGLSRLTDIFRRFGSAIPPKTLGPASQLWEQRSAMEFASAYYLTPPPHGTGLAPGVAPFPRLPVRPVVPSNAGGAQLLYAGTDAGVVFPAPVPAGESSEMAEAALVTARFLAWLYADSQQALLAAAGAVPVTASELGRSAFLQQYGVGAPGAEMVFSYPWPDQAWNGMSDALTQTLQGVLDDPGALQAQLKALSASLTQALQKAAASGPI